LGERRVLLKDFNDRSPVSDKKGLHDLMKPRENVHLNRRISIRSFVFNVKWQAEKKDEGGIDSAFFEP
jgi:hypothetical protein